MSSAAAVQRMYTGDIREIFRNPLALTGGVVGTVLIGIAFAFVVILAKTDCEKRLRTMWEGQGRAIWSDEFNVAVEGECDDAGDLDKCRERVRQDWLRQDRIVYSLPYALALDETCPILNEEDEFVVDFDPGAIMRLGQKIEDKPIPDKIIVAETQAEAPVEQVVTEDATVQPKVEEKKLEPEKDKPKSKLPSKSNNPYDDLPTVDALPGNPFGQANGWSDLQKDGDPWATSVMEALNNMSVGAYGAKVSAGDFKFKLTICKDGKIKKVTRKGGDLAADTQNAILLALDQTKIPKPPKKVADMMKSDCATIGYTFVWSTGGVK